MKSFLSCFYVNLFFILYAKTVSARQNDAFDLDLYENVLDREQCQKQLYYIKNNDTTLRLRFIDTSFRIPRNILKGNTRDLGSYFTCLEIDEHANNMNIEGKFSLISVPLDQDFPEFPDGSWPDLNITWPNITWPEPPEEEEDKEEDEDEVLLPELPWRQLNRASDYITKDMMRKMIGYEKFRAYVQRFLGTRAEDTSRIADTPFAALSFELACCIPKVCTPQEALDSFSNNLTYGMNFTERFTRLPNDKTWSAADTVAVVLLSVIGLITILSSAYDIHHTVLLERDPKKANKIFQSFSIYTNTKNFFVFPSGANVVTCLDGVRSFAMIWVIVGHTFVTQVSFIPENIVDIYQFMQQFTSLWVTSGTITVDTFFMISGLLVIYTTAGKVSRISLIKNLHLFYLNRLLRMFPVLAFGVLWTASFLHRMTDGPYFHAGVKGFVNNCRSNWWSTLLYVQNFVHPSYMCLPHSWYLAIDMQLHILSPIVLFFVLGQRPKLAWFALGTALVGIIAGSSVYNFINDFQSATISLARDDGADYLRMYYIHTLTRATPFFVGMIFGYLLHLYKGKKPRIPVGLALFLWVLALCGTSGVCLTTYWNIQPDWDNQLMDNIFNSYKRPIWAASVAWVIFACHTGYGGPVNWILSLQVFKILGRLSYAMYILHYPLIYLINATTLAPIYFSYHLSMYRFFIDFSFATIAAFVVTIFIDSPFTNLIKMAMGAGPKRPPVKKTPSLTKDNIPELHVTPVDGHADEKKTRL